MTSVVRTVAGRKRRLVYRRCQWAPCAKPFFARTDTPGKYCSLSCTASAANADPDRVRGENAANAKLGALDVRAIRDAWTQGANMGELARAFCVSSATIDCIVKRRSWRHLP